MNLQDLQNKISHFPKTEKMPVLFLAHGSPMNAIEENQFVQGFRNIATTLPKPKAILCVSAHWFTNGTFVTSGEIQKTIHDFSGFPPALYQVEYPAKGSPQLAEETTQLLLPAIATETENWGLDHGAWSVIIHLYPDADIPVIQLSIDYTKNADYHYELAKNLQKLRERGILIIGSGNVVHNLRMLDFSQIDTVGFGYDWAKEAQEKTNEWILDGNFKNLLEYDKQGRFLQLAVPTPDHFLPLIYTLGLKEKTDAVQLFNDELLGGSLSMTSVLIG